jgi:molybdate transport system substrate-binding protein
MSTPSLHCISSMATRLLLADLAELWQQRSGVSVHVESVGGVDAAKRVAAGEVFDLVVLASDAIDKLQTGGHVVAGSRADLVRSGVAVAVRAGAKRPGIGSEAALRAAVLAARSIGYSTGPSGTALLQLFERWGVVDGLRERLVQAPAGVPVGSMVAQGQVELGFQQRSELMHLPGIELVGAMPAGCAIVTTFSAGVCATSSQAEAARALIAFMQSPHTADLKRRHGMEPGDSE